MASLRHAIALLALPLGACAGPLNNEPGIGNAGRSFGHSVYTAATISEGLPPAPAEGLEPTTDQSLAPVYQASGAVVPQNAKPSLSGLDRDQWTPWRLDVPNDFPAHQPRMVYDYIIKTNDPRAQGRFPNERTALGISTTRHSNEQFVEALAAPFVAATDVVMMLPRAVMELRPSQPTRTGGEGYIRYPQQVTIESPTAAPEGTAARIDAGGGPRKPSPSRSGLPNRTLPPVSSPPPAPPSPPAEELRPGGGMPASDTPGSP